MIWCPICNATHVTFHCPYCGFPQSVKEPPMQVVLMNLDGTTRVHDAPPAEPSVTEALAAPADQKPWHVLYVDAIRYEVDPTAEHPDGLPVYRERTDAELAERAQRERAERRARWGP